MRADPWDAHVCAIVSFIIDPRSMLSIASVSTMFAAAVGNSFTWTGLVVSLLSCRCILPCSRALLIRWSRSAQVIHWSHQTPWMLALSITRRCLFRWQPFLSGDSDDESDDEILPFALIPISRMAIYVSAQPVVQSFAMRVHVPPLCWNASSQISLGVTNCRHFMNIFDCYIGNPSSWEHVLLLLTLSSVSDTVSESRESRTATWSHNGIAVASDPLQVMWSSSFRVSCCVHGESISCRIESSQSCSQVFDLVLPDQFMARTRFLHDGLRCCAVVRYSINNEFNADVWRAIELEPIESEAESWQYPLCSFCANTSSLGAEPRPTTHRCQMCQQFACSHCWSSARDAVGRHACGRCWGSTSLPF